MTDDVTLDDFKSLIASARNRHISIEDFCSRYETMFNVEANKTLFQTGELGVLSILFEKVIWFSPFKADLEKIPNYVGEDEIVNAINIAAEELGL